MDVVHVLAGHSRLQTTMEHYNQPSEERRLAAAAAVGEWVAARTGTD
jgi:hypothetical protein